MTQLHKQPYAGQYIWIVGASSGIGRALAHQLARQGARLALTARRKDMLNDLAQELYGDGHVVAPADVGDIAALQDAYHTIRQNFQHLDRSIFMAAIYRPHDGKRKDPAFVQDMLRVNIGGAFNMVECIAADYEDRSAGQIAICASVAGYRGLPTGQPYCATKAALISYAESLTVDMSEHNIDVKIINPGFVQTPLTDKNDFEMPLMISAKEAAHFIARDLRRNCFEIHFPKLFTLLMKCLRIAPPWLYFFIARRAIKR